MLRKPALDALDGVLLATVALAFVPGARAIAAWPALWFVPGWFLARRLLTARGFVLLPLALSLSVAVTTTLCLPATMLASRPTTLGILASISAAALACAYAGRSWLEFPSVPAPPRWFFVLLGGFFLLRLASAVRVVEPDFATPDGAYFVGMVRGLSTSFPPACFEHAPGRLAQPWGYWFLYAASHVVSGWSIARTLGIASALLAVAFAGSLYLLGYSVSGDRVAGALTLPLALGGGGAPWLADAGAWGGTASSGENVWDGFYDLPPLILLSLVLAVATLALRDRSPRLGVLAFVVAALLPLHHPTYFVVLALSLAAALAFELGRGSVSWLAVAALVVAPVPFHLLYMRLYAPGLPAQLPFFTDVITPSYWFGRSYERFLSVLAWGGLWIPLALVGAIRGPRGAPRSFPVALLGVSLALAVFTDNAAHNRHWTLDPLDVALVVLVASACASAMRTSRPFGLALTSVVLALGVVSGHWAGRLPERLAAIAAPRPRSTEAQRELAAWLRANTASDALFVAPANESPPIDAIEGLAERRLYCGFDFHLSLTMTPSALRVIEATNAEMLRDPASPALGRERIDYVVQTPPRDGASAWGRSARPAFENASFAVYRVRAAVMDPWLSPRTQPASR